MRVVLGQLSPALGEPARNLDRIEGVLRDHPAELVVLPELFLSGYRVGDRIRGLALAPEAEATARLGGLAAAHGTTVIVGAPWRHARAGEIENAALVAGPDGTVVVRGKRFLPTYGPFEEGSVFTPSPASETVVAGGRRLGVQICYDAFFPEVARQLALAGAELLVVISAAPVTSRRLFDKVLPARAVENALPLVYVNRVGVEDGLVFGGGSLALDARGEPVHGPGEPGPEDRGAETVWTVEIDLTEAARWRPFRPVLRDLASRPAPPPEGRRSPTPR